MLSFINLPMKLTDWYFKPQKNFSTSYTPKSSWLWHFFLESHSFMFHYQIIMSPFSKACLLGNRANLLVQGKYEKLVLTILAFHSPSYVKWKKMNYIFNVTFSRALDLFLGESAMLFLRPGPQGKWYLINYLRGHKAKEMRKKSRSSFQENEMCFFY